jgi:ATP-dependent DNA helicase PIF1
LLIEDILKSFSEFNADFIAMREIEDILRLHGKSFKDYGLPEPSNFKPKQIFDVEKEKLQGEGNRIKLNEQQRQAFEKIMRAINTRSQDNCFFLDAPGGSGKTFLYNTLMNVLRGKEKIVIPVASTGIAATLLAGGRTYHSQFKLPIPLKENSTSNMRENSQDAKLLKESSLIIWDEATMATHHALDAVDRLLKDLMGNDSPFGGKVILLGGDFRQCLPVVKHANRVVIVQSSIKYSRLWPSFQQLKLERNMRTVGGNKDFLDWLIRLRDGRLNNEGETVVIPSKFVIENSLIDFIYGKHFTFKDVISLSDRAILCPKNDSTMKMNDEIINRLEGESKTYLSIDTVESENDSDRLAYPTEVLNSLAISGLPPHKLTLKKGCVIILLRNLNTRAGLCNGTRLIIREMKNNVIDAHILKGKRLGQRVFIPRVDLIPTEDEFPITIRRRQFPIRPAFAMTINKSQGQTFERVGIYLPSPVSSHGQLYVAFSRATSKENIRIKIQKTERQGRIKENSDKFSTINCVYREIFEGQKFYTESEKNHKDIQQVFPPMDIEPNNVLTNSNSTVENYCDSDSESESVKTINYLDDLSFQSDLDSKAHRALKKLIDNNAYHSMDTLFNEWSKNGFQSLATEIITHIRSFPERIYSNERQVDSYYYNLIDDSDLHKFVLNYFFAVETEAKGDCLYKAISISLTGNGSLSTAIRFATVAKIIEFKDQLEPVVNRFDECIKRIYSDTSVYKCKLQDLAFSAGITRTFIRISINELRFPEHLINADLDPIAKEKLYWGTLFHQFIISMVTNRLINCYGAMDRERAQFVDRPPINFIHVDRNHYVALLLYYDDTMLNQRYTYQCRFMYDEEHQAFRGRFPHEIPPNEIVDENQQEIWID